MKKYERELKIDRSLNKLVIKIVINVAPNIIFIAKAVQKKNQTLL